MWNADGDVQMATAIVGFEIRLMKKGGFNFGLKKHTSIRIKPPHAAKTPQRHSSLII